MQYPKYLEQEKLPLMHTAITKLVQKIISCELRVAQLVVAYAPPPADQVETQAMISLFEEWIPSIAVLNVKADTGDVSSCFDEVAYQREEIYRNSTPLKNTKERKLIALASAYFGHRNYEYKLENPQQQMDGNNQEYYDFLGRIPGITIINRCMATEDTRTCHSLTFGKQDWYKKIVSNDTLLGHPKNVLRFLREKGYKKSETPVPKQIVVYHTAKQVRLFGKIAEVDKEGHIWVISKFGRSHFYKHRLELVQFHYGNSVTFLKEPACSKKQVR